MKKLLFSVLAGVLAGMTFVPAHAQDDAEKSFDFNGMVRARYDYLNNYLDLTDNDQSGDPNDDSFGNTPYRVMIGMTGTFAKNVTAHVDLQYTGHFGDEFNPSKDNPFFNNFPPPVGQTDAAHQGATQGVQLYQGWFEMGKMWGSDFSVRVGRQEHTYGTELFLGDNDYYSGLSFDGVRGMWNHGRNDLNVFYYVISENNCFSPCFGLPGSRDSDLWGATYDFKFEKWGTVGAYALVAQDLGGDGPVGFPDSSIVTYGARWNRGMMNEDKLNMFDWNLEVAAQTGDLGEPAGFSPAIDINALVAEGWFGFNFNVGESHGRAHIGFLSTSGDDTTTLDEDEGFYSLYGDFHANNRFGDLDWWESVSGGPHNISDVNVGYDHWFGEAHRVWFAYHMLQLTEDNGAPTGDKIGDEINLGYAYNYSKNLSFEVFIGQLAADDDQFGFSTDPVQRASVQAKLTW
jgi:hypothetical protein